MTIQDRLSSDFNIPKLIDTNEVAILLRCTKEHVKLSRSTGELLGIKAPPYYKFGRKVLYNAKDINEFLQSIKIAP